VKVLHLISQRPDSTGSGIYLQQLMGHAHRAGQTNFLICALSGDEEVELEGVAADRISAVRFSTPANPGAIVGMSDVMPYPSRTFGSLTPGELNSYASHFRGAIEHGVKKWRPDLIHSHHLWLVSSLAREAAPGIPIVCSCHGSDLRQFRQCTHLRDRVLAGCRELTRVLALSHDQKTQIIQTYGIEPQHIDVAGAGFDDELFSATGGSAGSAAAPKIVYAGKLSRAKGIVWLLKALQSLAHCPYHLHLVGSGQGVEAEQVHTEADRLGDRVTIHGPLSQEQLARVLQDSELFVLPSLFEGLPLVVLEALACGCRVIATDLPGCREIRERTAAEMLQLVPLPAVIDLTHTTLDNEEKFVGNLRDALSLFLEKRRPLPDTTLDLGYFRWSAVYKRVEKNWREACATFQSC
jgi:glycosyltransferase involved in cell wall biosynthesis